MAQKIMSYKNLAEDERSARILRVQVVKNEAVERFQNISLERFVSDQSLGFFEYFEVNIDFLTEDSKN